jgi:FkbM family methyltransferase
MTTSYDSNTRAAEHPQLLEGLNKAISEYHLIEGGSFQIRAQVARLREFVAKRQPKSIMEIGFNGGHSALLFLSITPPETKVVSFDLGEYAYVFAAKRHTLVTGDSTTTIPNYEEQVAHRLKIKETAPPLKFDLIFIDGGHQDDIPLKDILNSQRLARDDKTIVAIDDICRNPSRHAHYTVEPTKAWDQMVITGVITEHGFDDYYEIMMKNNENGVDGCKARGMAWGEYSLLPGADEDAGSSAEVDAVVAAAKSDPTPAFKKLRYNYYRNSCKFMDRNQMLQEIHKQHHHTKDLEKLIAVADMYLEYFPTYNKRDSNFVKFYRACSNFTLNPLLSIKQFEEIVDTPSPPPNDVNGTNNSESELPDSIKNAAIANIGMLYGEDPCSSIPKIIHLLYFGETEFYNFHHRCVHSMLQHMPNYDIRIYNAKEPVGNAFWDDIKKQARVSIHKMDPPVFYDGFELKHFQYKADVVRLELLYEHGGVYLDLDMLITRPFDDVFSSGHSFYISEECANGAGNGALINAFLAAKPKNEFIKLWLNEFKSGLRLGIWATHIRDSNKQLLQDHPHYMHKYRIRILDGKLFMALHWQDTVAFIHSETIPHEFPSESYGTHLWETILGDVMKKNEFLKKQKMELTVYNSRSSPFYAGSDRDAVLAAAATEETDNDDDLTIYPEYYHDYRNDQYVDKYITKGKHGGYFIEIGAGDGETNSSCYFFERYREWRGLTVEPARIYHDKIRSCRASLMPVAVTSITSSITNGSGRGAIFYESVKPERSGLKGTLENNKEGDEWTQIGFKSYKVDTITLYDMCCQQSAPDHIDYCAIDCEGGECEILSTYFEENQATPTTNGEHEVETNIGLVVTNKVFQINFFSIEVTSDKMYAKIRDLMKKNHYEETVNPYLSVIRQGNNNDHATKTQKAYFKYKGTDTTNSPQLSDRSLSSISSGANATPHTTHTPPSSPSSPEVSPSKPSNASFLLRPPFAEEVVAICIEERPERTKYVSNELLSHGIRHSLLMNKMYSEDTKIGCFRSHMKAIQYAYSKNLSAVLIVEDDIVIRNNILELATIPLPSDGNWDILYLGGILTKYDGMDPSRKWVNGTIWCNHAYIVKQHMYKPILDFVESYPNLIELEKKNIDFMYTEYIQPKYKCWLANDQYIIQKEGYSEIDGRVKWANGFDWNTFSMKVI